MEAASYPLGDAYAFGVTVYLDHAATTPLRPEARAARLPFLGEDFGNPSGSHAVARRAKQALEEAREVVATGLGARPAEVVLTGGGTEADNLAVTGVWQVVGGAVVCTAIEHHAVLHACQRLAGRVVPVTPSGVVDLDALAAAVQATVSQRKDTVDRVTRLRDRLTDAILAAVQDARETGDRAGKIAGNCHLRFEGVESEALLVLLDEAGVCASAGSACASGALEASHVLTAMGVPGPEALASVRLSLGWTSTDEDVELARKMLPDAIASLKGA